MTENVDAFWPKLRYMNGQDVPLLFQNIRELIRRCHAFLKQSQSIFQSEKIWFLPPQQYDFVLELTRNVISDHGVGLDKSSCDATWRCLNPNYHCPLKPPFFSKNSIHFQSILIDFLAPGYALSFDVFKITLLTGRGYPPSFTK